MKLFKYNLIFLLALLLGAGVLLNSGCGDDDDDDDATQGDDDATGDDDTGDDDATGDDDMTSDDDDDATGDVAQSDQKRVEDPDVPTGDLDELVAGNSEFAFDLYRQLRGEEGNFMYSPYSISIALAMTYAGARGDTETQMANVMHFTLSQDNLHPAFNYLDLALESRGEGAEGKDDKGFRLNIANAIWGQEGYEFLDEFLDTLALNYGAGLRLLDFFGDPDGSRITINEWVEQKTEGKIKDLLQEGVITSDTKLVLTNAIYFNAAWALPFDDTFTRDGEFTRLDGSPVTVPMMVQEEGFSYAADEGYEAIELPYDGYELSMVIVVPDDFGQFEADLDFADVDQIIGAMNWQQVRVTMPKYKYESKFGLGEILPLMGMSDAFDSMVADFSGMNGKKTLFIMDVIHQSFIAVDEAGTEAAAATAVVVGDTGMPPEPIEMNIDRPFIYLIRDVETGALLFVGRVVDPS